MVESWRRAKNTIRCSRPRRRAAARVADYLGLERNVVVVSAVVFLLGFGEELWKRYLPKYLEALGAGAGIVGLFGTTRDFFDAVYQYPGGWLADRVGRRRAFLTFIALASVGYLVYLLSPSWPYVFVGLAFSMAGPAWRAPAVFAVIGDALPKERRAMGFTFQSMLKRVPMAFAPLAGGTLIASRGVVYGVRAGLVVMLLLALAGAADRRLRSTSPWRSARTRTSAASGARSTRRSSVCSSPTSSSGRARGWPTSSSSST